MMFNRSMYMISASAIICVCCGLSFADPATDSQVGKEIQKELQVQRDQSEIARGGRSRRRGNVAPSYGTYNTQTGTAAVKKDEPQKEDKAVKDEQANDAKDAATTEQKDVKDVATTEQKDVKDAATTEQKDAKDAATTEQKDAKDAATTEQKDAKDGEAKKEEPASPFKDPQIALAFQEFNNFRIRNGLKPCEFNQNLQNIAQWHSNNMYNRRQLYHSGTPYVAENVFMGSASGVHAVRVWMNSPGHRANMLGPYRRVGIARTGSFYTMVLQ